MITTSRFFKEKQYMWYKVRELQSKGLNKTQIGKHLGVDRSTVRRYLQMSREDFVRRRNSHRKYTLKLAGYEEYVRGTLEEYPYISVAKLLQKSEMRKNMVMDLIYRGFINAANYSESHYNPRRSQIKTELRYLFVTTPNR